MIPQMDEILILDGKETRMPFCPVLPQGHPRVVETSTEDPERIQFSEWITSGACLRRYRGTWEIEEDRFYLAHLQGMFKLMGDGRLFADWFTGVLTILPRDEVFFFHKESGAVWEKERFMEISNGLVVKSLVLDTNGSRWDEFALGLRKHPGSGSSIVVPGFVENSEDDPVCEFCGRKGVHPECREQVNKIWAARQILLRRFTIDGRFGPVTKDPEMTLADAVFILTKHLGYQPEFDVTQVIENKNWWLIPHGWIGMLGFIVEKRNRRITELGSGLGGLLEAIQAYESGVVEPVATKL